jgi:hypothetical protein
MDERSIAVGMGAGWNVFLKYCADKEELLFSRLAMSQLAKWRILFVFVSCRDLLAQLFNE